MLRERDTPMHLFDLVPTLSMALDPVLTQRDRRLDDDTLFQAVKADLAHRLPRPLLDGRPSTPVEVILRMLVVKHLYGWSDEATARWVGDRLVWRQCCRVEAEPGPEETTLRRWAHLIQPVTLHRGLDHLVVLARSLTSTRGRKLRLEGTVGATTSHHPTDRTWLDDGVRGLSRRVGDAKQARQEATVLARRAFRNRTRSATRQMQRIMEAARQRGAQVEDRRRTASQRRLTITTPMGQQAARVGSVRIDHGTPRGRQVATALHRVVPWGQPVMTQTTRRLCQGEAVPAPAQVVSLVEPHPAIMRQGKPGQPTACGRGLWLDAVEGGIMSRDAGLEGNPAADAPLPPSLDQHRHVGQRPPRLLAGERGLHTTANER